MIAERLPISAALTMTGQLGVATYRSDSAVHAIRLSMVIAAVLIVISVAAALAVAAINAL